MRVFHLTNSIGLSVLLSLFIFQEGKSQESSAIKLISVPPTLELASHLKDHISFKIVIKGIFPNHCYQVGSGSVDVYPHQGKIIIENFDHFFPDKKCGQLNLPYLKVINIPAIPAGVYQINFVDAERRQFPRGTIAIMFPQLN